MSLCNISISPKCLMDEGLLCFSSALSRDETLAEISDNCLTNINVCVCVPKAPRWSRKYFLLHDETVSLVNIMSSRNRKKARGL